MASSSTHVYIRPDDRSRSSWISPSQPPSFRTSKPSGCPSSTSYCHLNGEGKSTQAACCRSHAVSCHPISVCRPALATSHRVRCRRLHPRHIDLLYPRASILSLVLLLVLIAAPHPCAAFPRLAGLLPSSASFLHSRSLPPQSLALPDTDPTVQENQSPVRVVESDDRTADSVSPSLSSYRLVRRQDSNGGGINGIGGGDSNAPAASTPTSSTASNTAVSSSSAVATGSTSVSRFAIASTTASPSGAVSASASKSASVALSAAASLTSIDADTPGPTTMPKPFDSSLGNNFTNPACPQFFSTFLNDPQFTSCLPLSLLLGNSQSFFTAQQSAQLLRQVLDTSCNVDASHCDAVLGNYAKQILQPSTCGPDFKAQNPLVLRAYNGFMSYMPLYQAGCLKGDSSGLSSGPSANRSEYCFVSASSNTTAPADSYLYYLPLGIPLPGSSRPTCSACVQQTMQIFATAAQNLSSPLSGDYSPAAAQVNTACGPSWVSPAVKPIQGSATQTPNAATGVFTIPAAQLFSLWTLTFVAGMLLL